MLDDEEEKSDIKSVVTGIAVNRWFCIKAVKSESRVFILFNMDRSLLNAILLIGAIILSMVLISINGCASYRDRNFIERSEMYTLECTFDMIAKDVEPVNAENICKNIYIHRYHAMEEMEADKMISIEKSNDEKFLIKE